MKIGIISVNNAHNFGSCMQAYALLTYLKNLGHSVQVINYRNPHIENSYRIQKKPGKQFRSKLKYGVMYSVKVLKKPYLVKRRKRFEDFFNHYFNLTEPATTYKQLCVANFDFDAAFAGSDQIWNPNIVKSIDPAFFLKFLDSSAICASYAASLGIEELSAPQQAVFAEYLQHLDYISVREQSAQALLQPMTKKPVDLIADPTVLLQASDYEELLCKRPYEGDYIYVHVHHYTAKSPELVKMAEALSEITGLPVIHNIQGLHFKHQAGHTCAAGPKETLSALYHAKYVLTQSFHITMFSLIFHKTFVTMKRERYNTRLEQLLSAVGMADHLVDPDTVPDLNSLSRDFSPVEKYFKTERAKATSYIDKVLSGKKQTPTQNYFLSSDPFTCYGCSACADSCPAKAIEMRPDKEGFVRPHINQEKCIHCKLCERICIWGKNSAAPSEDRKGYLSFARDENTHVYSSSGGISTVLGQFVIRQGGYVVGVRWAKPGFAVYDITDTLEGLDAFRYSKYVEPQHGDIYKKTKAALETGKPVLFVGMPCKVAGLKAYLRQDYENLITAELVCECSPSPLVLPNYLRKKSGSAQSNLISVRFREPVGWTDRKTAYIYENGKTELSHYKKDLYFQCFVKRYLSKLSCYRCEFTRFKAGSDFVMGDFWGAEELFPHEDLSRGVSCLITNSKKGEEILHSLHDVLELRSVPVKFILDHNASWPSAYNIQRVTLVQDIVEKPERTEILLHKARYGK